ncbi:membrane protein DedA with SNARE-associated domain [Saccharomonospora amisosensis]|uniref:Membrane protein DedA with SNARE-associated domain n=1 Tax=Saccharomonospora amisosensis TaxID=1128677 RepID=A0A7X5ULV2_9PSEU|nr:DedA family protein [Saccharomonospora amisosensis]NIJ10381.1 membrane protein DedA with SNARE-associated domain [Saccharomonospora amisosensis]
MVTDLLDWLRSLPQAGLLAAAGLLVFGECTLGLGFIAPGETALLILGTTVTGAPSFLLMWSVTTVSAVAGDTVGYLLGRRFGPRLRRTKAVRRYGADAWDRATSVLRRRGALAVLFAIFLPVLRTLLPAAAGASGLPPRGFLPAVIVGASAWCALHISLGFAAGTAVRELEDAVGFGGWLVLGLIVVVTVIVVLVKRRRAGRGAKG